MLYAVSQFDNGHEYRWIYEEEVLSRNIYKNGTVPEKDCLDCGFPIGGSNSSATWLKKLADEEAAKDFLLAPCEGTDVENPLLIDIGEYILSVDEGYESCTSSIVKKMGVSSPELEQSDCRRDDVIFMSKKMKTLMDGWEDPFYGKFRNMRYSEMESLYNDFLSKGGN